MDSINQTHPKNLIFSLFLSLLFIITFIISPSSSSSSSLSSNRHTGVLEETEDMDEKSRYRLVYIKKTTPFVIDQQERHYHHDRHHHRRHHHHHLHRHHRNPRVRYFKMIKKRSGKKREMAAVDAAGKKNRPNLPVGPSAFSVMLPKGYVPPSGSSPCHNQNPNSASTSRFCDLSVSRKP